MASARGPEYPVRGVLDGLYRAVLVDDDGRRTVLATHMTIDRANALAEALSGVCAFKSIEIASEHVAAPAPSIAHQPQSGFEQAD